MHNSFHSLNVAIEHVDKFGNCYHSVVYSMAVSIVDMPYVILLILDIIQLIKFTKVYRLVSHFIMILQKIPVTWLDQKEHCDWRQLMSKSRFGRL